MLQEKIVGQKGQASLVQVPLPVLHPGWVLVQNHYSFVSRGTETSILQASAQSIWQKAQDKVASKLQTVLTHYMLHGFKDTVNFVQGHLNRAFDLGYACAGQVIEATPESKFKVGDFVACAGVGFAGHAQMVAVPENLCVRVSNPDYLRAASSAALGAIALHALRRAECQVGETVCIQGLGLVGQLLLQLAKINGLKVIGIDPEAKNLELAHKLGCDFVFSSQMPDLARQVELATGSIGADAVFIATGAPNALNVAAKFARSKGRLVLVGGTNLEVDRQIVYKKELDVRVSTSYGPGRYDKSYEELGADYPVAYVRWTAGRNMQLIVDLIEQKKLNIDVFVQKEFTLDQVEKAYAHLQEQLGVVFAYKRPDLSAQAQIPREPSELLAVPFQFGQQEKLSTAVVGLGGFAKQMLLPLLANHSDLSLDYLVDQDLVNLHNLSAQYSVDQVCTSINSDFFVQTQTDLVVIATPHKEHAEQVSLALQANRAVLVEKPALIDWQQWQKLATLFAQPAMLHKFCIDFNRSFAPMSQQVKKLCAKRHSNLLINYTVHADSLPSGHWLQDKLHRGRLIGEACHFLELFLFLVDRKPTSLTVNVARDFEQAMVLQDNFTLSLSFSDGSLANLVYSANANQHPGKERMEINWQNQNVILTDYSKLVSFGAAEKINEVYCVPQKGHQQIIEQFLHCLKTQNFASWQPVVTRQLQATYLSLLAQDLLEQGGGHLILNQQLHAPAFGIFS